MGSLRLGLGPGDARLIGEGRVIVGAVVHLRSKYHVAESRFARTDTSYVGIHPFGHSAVGIVVE